jgi:hypothetical protein
VLLEKIDSDGPVVDRSILQLIGSTTTARQAASQSLLTAINLRKADIRS